MKPTIKTGMSFSAMSLVSIPLYDANQILQILKTLSEEVFEILSCLQMKEIVITVTFLIKFVVSRWYMIDSKEWSDEQYSLSICHL